MKQTNYCGYRISFDCNAEWFALIYAPGAPFPMGDMPKASLQEGEQILLERARAAIDERLEHETMNSRRQA